ncbi:MAG: ABC transporter permease [Bacteroidetes bacterium]|nr:ABC transporter permease [Bacteroidota bacterium]
MFKTNLKIAWRQLLKDRQFTFLNVLGLSAGIACTLLIFLWVNDELSFDKFNEKDSQLYQLMEQRTGNGQTAISDESSGLLSAAVAAQMPQVEYAASVAPPEWFQKFTLSVGEKNLKAIGQYVGKDYFNIFSFKLIEGKKSQVLENKNSIVISDELAKKLFNTTENIIGKTIRFQHERDFVVSGIFEKVPYHSSQQFDFVLSFEYYADVQSWVKSWNNTGPHNFVILKKGTDIESFNKKIANIITVNLGDSTRTPFAMRFSDIYLHSSFDHGSRVGGKMEYVRLFSLIAIFILAIACINFMNLSTAKASRRLKEVGIKKVVGAERSQLIFQFLTESMLLTLAATLFAIVVALMLLPEFNQLTGKQIAFHVDARLIGGLIGIILFTGLLSGSYPALYLSSFNPISILKGKLRSSLAEVISRKGLVVFQFSLSVILIVSVLLVNKQIQYIQKSNPGYNKDNIVRLDAEGKIVGTEDLFIAQLKKIPGVVNAAYTFNNMVGRNFGNNGIDWEGKDPHSSIYFEGFGASYGFIETMNMQMAAGRSFSRNFGDGKYGEETSKIIFNEAAIKLMGIKDPVGKTVKLFNRPMQIIGVVKDFHFESLHEPVKPAYMQLEGQNNGWHKIMIRIKGGEEQETIARIQQFYENYNPGFPFAFNFLDEAYQKQYTTETRVSILSRYFAALAIIISCLGLFGLATFTAQRRQKEIGIRKVVGASVNNIVAMLSKDFLKLVLISVLIAFPLSYFAMNHWLEGFAYRISIGADVFVLAGGSVFLITIITISYQAIKAALANPVKSLRTE